ncbi:MAG: SgcJ/EcaC family oxidoreductase [Rhizobiaceae bacterium]
MKALTKNVLAAVAILASTAGVAVAQNEKDRGAIEAVLETYETALNTSDTATVITLYTEDGVFMPQHSLPNVGTDAVRAAYENVFHAIKLDVVFEIDEIAQIAPDWAFVRTRSQGFVTISATGARMPEGNQELFVFNKTGSGDWKIARYIFSTTNPPRQ